MVAGGAFFTLDFSRVTVDGSFRALAVSFLAFGPTGPMRTFALSVCSLPVVVIVGRFTPDIFTIEDTFLKPACPSFDGIFVGDLFVPGFVGLGSRELVLELPRETFFTFKLILLFRRTGILVLFSPSLFGVPAMGDRADGFDMRLAARTIELAVTPRSIIVLLSTLRCRSGDVDLPLLSTARLILFLRTGGIRSILFVTLIRRGIFDGELSALLIIRIRPF